MPSDFAHLDSRGVIRLSTKIKVANDRSGTKASRVAARMNETHEAYWRSYLIAPSTLETTCEKPLSARTAPRRTHANDVATATPEGRASATAAQGTVNVANDTLALTA